MQPHRVLSINRVRRLALSLAILTGSLTALAGGTDASAGTLIPLVDMGGSGGGGSVATLAVPYAGSQNARSVALVESRQAGGVVVAIDLSEEEINFCSSCGRLV
jgi:hypothetical protein